MSTTEVQRIDLTAPSDGLTYVEILTPAGIVRVNTNLVDWRTKRPVVVVEVERQAPYWLNTDYQGAHTAPEGEWDAEVSEQPRGFDVKLTKKDG